MGDFSLKFKADQLGKDLEIASIEIEDELNQAISDLAHAAYASIVADAQKELNSTRVDYLKALSFDKLGDNEYLISLDGKAANATEDGYGSFDMKEKMLQSDKIVAGGSRAGQKWVRENAQGKKYAAVPFEHKATPKKATGDLAADIRNLTATNRRGRKQKINRTFKDEQGKPLVGKVATATSENPILNKITKFQHVSEKGAVSSIYMSWRMVSEDSTGFIHPGYEGVHLFSEAEKFVEDQLEQIVKTLL